MFIISQDGKAIINMDQVSSIFTNNQHRICATFLNSTGCQLGEYEYGTDKAAIKALANAARSNAGVFSMPKSDALLSQIDAEDAHGHRETHAANGAVIRRNGGS